MLFNRDWKTVCSRRFFRWRACAARHKTRGFSGFCAGKIVLQLEVCAWDFHRLNSVEVSISRVLAMFCEKLSTGARLAGAERRAQWRNVVHLSGICLCGSGLARDGLQSTAFTQ